MENQAIQLLHEGIAALKSGDTLAALHCLEDARRKDDQPEILSTLALCIARERKDFAEAVALCRQALGEEPWNSSHYLNLGRIHLLEGRKKDAIRVFRDGLLHQPNPAIRDELQKLGTRKYPVIASLPREHRMNVFLGKLFTKLGLR